MSSFLYAFSNTVNSIKKLKSLVIIKLMKSVLVVGSGWAGVSASYMLQNQGYNTTILEQKNVIGGHSRSEIHKGVVYEPNGPHIFHTSSKEVNDFVTSFGMKRKFTHKVKSRIYPKSLKGESTLVSWPPQISEMEKFSEWKKIKTEINNLPKSIDKSNFETYAISIMGITLYELFIYGYTKKQWGMEPNQLSSNFAPKRIDLRTDENKALFKDKWEYFHPEGSGKIIENIASILNIEKNIKVNINNINEVSKNYDKIIITAALDDFLNHSKKLEWRGIKSKINYYDNLKEDECITEAYQINHPSLNEDYTRTVETKHASGQKISSSIVQEEFSFPDIRHYPVYRSKRNPQMENNILKKLIIDEVGEKVFFSGRLANYVYINQDEAILDGFNTARRILEK